MEVPLTVIVGAGLLLTFVIYSFLVHPVYISPLAKVPTAHWSTSFSSLWAQYYRVTHQITFRVHEAHQRFGSIVRIAPNEISVNCVEGGLRTIYAGGYEKGSWYANVFNNYGIRPMFCMEDRTSHSRRKRMISNVYAKSTLQGSASLSAISRTILSEKLLPQLNAYAASDQAFDIYDIFTAVTLDMITAYTVGLGNGSAMLDDLPYATQFTRAFKAGQRSYVWPQDLPMFTAFMTKIGLRELIVPSRYAGANVNIEDWVMGMCEKAESTLSSRSELQPEDYPTVYAQLRAGMLKTSEEKEMLDASLRYELASELVDHIIAGFDTSSITLTWLTWQLSRPINKDWQQRLQQELAAHPTSDPKTLDSLPVLEAILMETLRLNGAIPGNQPRITPANATIGPPGQEYAGLPAGIRVQAQAWSIHRNPEVFPVPDEWQPGRWLDATREQHQEMMRWFWAFGSGGRMCIGSNLALYEMKAIIALMWRHFTTEIEYDEGMVMNGGYQAEPLGKNGRYLEIRLNKVR
ncbi:hypothetical protein AMS68_004664 [Peltaster fructicola]|uniref:Cytochrome P450 n=1 Tax=Peltaster fructicola TaxID=286661 RepID=A0A6H0XWK8_9PEZI|nr:hypothetical protein AMS68_004664 [Peltaster fructicola]